MASQQVLFAETIAGMKKAFKRKVYESDSDSDIDIYGNRGYKLKKKARFAHRGQLVPPSGPSAYKEYVEYGGVRRAILHRNPPLIDDEGYEIDSDDDEERIQDAEIVAAELNPYANIRLEHILAPLTASTDLPTHPTLSKPFTSTTLSELAKESCTIMQKENHSLWKVRHLLTALCGDFTWVPCEAMVGTSDIDLFTTEMKSAQGLLSLSKPQTAGLENVQSPSTINGDRREHLNGSANNQASPVTTGEPERPANAAQEGDVSMVDVDVIKKEESSSEQKNQHEAEHGGEHAASEANATAKAGGVETEQHNEQANAQNANGKPEHLKETPDQGVRTEDMAVDTTEPPKHPDVDAVDGTENPHQVISLNGVEESLIHPMFLPPIGAKPDRDVGLPEQEAEDIRRLLALFVQKQEEICRGAKKLYQGLLRADRLRKDVLHWSKAEAHSGPNRDMSDGEDWYDREEWGLTEDLKKGQDEEEEDAVTTGKKTRNRR